MKHSFFLKIRGDRAISKGDHHMQFKKIIALSALSIVLSGAYAGTASASNYYNDFSNIGIYYGNYPGSTPYAQGGISVQYIGSPGGIWTTYQSVAGSNYGWYPNGGSDGYDAITLTGGGVFNSISLVLGNGGGTAPHFAYQLLNGSTVVGSGFDSPIMSWDMGSIYSFSGIFTQVNVQAIADGISTSFNPVGFDTLSIGSVSIASVPGPEAGTGLISALGFGALAFWQLRRRQQTA